ncbi:Chemotaxis protein PomA [bioreactor metagenome]|uniref:Chemotaxis protein PomA n=1 Tax=bioreactor metagenome TaxID=1076179 RepID=A0A645CH84_9ZZZZ
MFKLMGIAFYPPQYNKKEISFQILEYSLITRKSGMLAIEDKVNAAKHPYIKKIFQAGIDGADANALEELFMLEIEGINNRHNENTGFFQKLGGLSPTMGIIGTVMGLISTMGSASENGDADVLIYNISIAFLATLWGIAMANLVWIPIADKLQFVHNEEVEVLELIFEGAKSVVSGESTLVISSKLSSMLPFSAQMQFNREAKSFIESRRQTLQQTKTT